MPPRVLRAGSGVIRIVAPPAGLLLVVSGYLRMLEGNWSHAKIAIGCSAAFIALAYFLPGIGQRIEVDTESIALRMRDRVLVRVRFADVHYSYVSEWEEIGWPARIVLVGVHDIVLLSLHVKSIAREDTDWLMSLPQLKLRKEANQAPDRTSPSVTPPAAQEPRH